MWIEPKICRDDAEGAKQLPVSGAKEDCPPCNPGMHLNNTNGTGGSECVYCPVNQFSDGKAGVWHVIPVLKPSVFSAFVYTSKINYVLFSIFSIVNSTS